jgi:putative proteasome-type protease
MWHGGATDVPLMVPAARNTLLKKISTPDEKLI